VRLDAQIGGHTGQNNLANAMLAQLKREIVILRPVNLVWSGDNSTSVLNIGLELIQPVGTGFLEALEAKGPLAIEHTDLVHLLLERAAKLPVMVGRIVVMR
jgi:hypothetical protein